MLPPPSRRTSPNLDLREEIPDGPAARVRRGSLHLEALISHKFMPQASLMSMGAILPRKMEARKEETRVIREVAS